MWKQKHGSIQKPNFHWVNKAPVSLHRIPDVENNFFTEFRKKESVSNFRLNRLLYSDV